MEKYIVQIEFRYKAIPNYKNDEDAEIDEIVEIAFETKGVI